MTTTISTSGTIGVQITLASQNPVTVTSTGTIVTTGPYAISDIAVVTASTGQDEITNNGMLQGQYGIEFNGPSAVGVVNNFGRIVGTADNAIYLEDEVAVVNGSATDTTASITSGNAADYNPFAILFAAQPEGDDLVINYGTISGPGGISMAAGQLDQVFNYGTVSGSGSGIVTYGSGQATITNGSTADTTAAITGEVGIDFDGTPAWQVNNFGSIAGTAGEGVFSNSYGTVVNGSAADTAASITGSSDGIAIEGSSGPSAVSNYGTIASGSDGIEDTGTAAIMVANYGIITGTNGVGVGAGGVTTLSNLGAISGFDSLSLGGGSITNGSAADTTASISGSNAAILMGAAGTLANFGKISGSIQMSGTITNGSTADTVASITGLIQATGVATVSNFGSDVGGLALVAAGGNVVTNGSVTDTVASISGSNGVTFAGGAPSTISNFGSVHGSYDAGIAASGTAYVTNGSAADTKATITGSEWGIYDYAGTVANFGTISSVFLSSGTVTNSGTIGGGNIGVDVGAGGTVINSGTIVTGTDAAINLNSASNLVNGAGGLIGNAYGTVATVVNDGTIDVGVAYTVFDVSSDVDPSSTGVFQLTGRGELDIAAALGTSLKIQFLGTTTAAELLIDNAANFGQHAGSSSYAGPLLEGFAAGDEIDLKGITNAASSYSIATGDLQITSAGKAVATLMFQNSSLGAGTFHTANDGNGGTWVTHS
ncbi:MAG: hypothetical protein ABSC06_30870 [Rhodopila sp.]|jgi:hypothetical protein